MRGQRFFVFKNKTRHRKMTNKLILILALLCRVGVHAQDVSLNGVWAFKIDPRNVGEREGWHKAGAVIKGWDEMLVPYNWQLCAAYENYSGKAWYSRTFDSPELTSEQEAALEFEAVFHDCKVWLNGEYLGASHSGFFLFELDISKKLKRNGKNTLTVMADNTFRIGATWNWGGIRRPVTLRIKPKVNVSRLFITPAADLQKKCAHVAVKAAIYNHENSEKKVSGLLAVLFDGKVMASKQAVVKAPPEDTVSLDFNFALTPRQTFLWHFDSPNLYTAQFTLRDDVGRVIAKKTHRFGIRKVEVKGYELLLNGESVRLVGFNYVPDDRVSGNTLPAWRYKEDIDLMKSAGANMARFSHLPLPEETLDYLDEKGILHYAEIPLWGSENILANKNDPVPKRWLDLLIKQQYNHASIVGWSVGNEIGFNPNALEYVRNAIDYVKNKLDKSRMVTDVSYSASKNKADAAQFADMILLNAYGVKQAGQSARDANKNHPDKPIFMSEFGDVLNADDLDARVPIKSLMDSLRNKPYVAGASLWTYNDYRSHYQSNTENWSTPPSENRTWGVVNVHRQKKKAYYDVRKEFAPVRKLSVSEKSNNIHVTVAPRGKFDIPAYVLRGYYLVVTAYDAEDKLIQSQFASLPAVKPGAPPFALNFQMDKKTARYLVALSTPLQYHVSDTMINLKPPLSPQVAEVQNGKSAARIYFKKSAGAEEVYARYGYGSLTEKTKGTINDFIEVPFREAKKDAPLTIALAARNSMGESIHNKTIQVRPSVGLLPPAIYKTGSAEGGFMIGYGSEKTDYLYQVEYRILPDETVYAEQSPSRGVMLINGLPEGKEVKFRFRKLDQTHVASAWSDYHFVTTGLPKAVKEIPLSGLYKSKDRQWLKWQKETSAHQLSRNIHGEEAWMVYFHSAEFAASYRVKFYDEKGEEVYSEEANNSRLNGWMVPVSKTGKASAAKVFAQFGAAF